MNGLKVSSITQYFTDVVSKPGPVARSVTTRQII